VKIVFLVREWTDYFLVSISEPETKTVTRGKPYNFALLNSPKFLSQRSVPGKKCISEAR
jgi:hypothetical protein